MNRNMWLLFAFGSECRELVFAQGFGFGISKKAVKYAADVLEVEGDRSAIEGGIPDFGFREVFEVSMDFFLGLQEGVGNGLEEGGDACNGAAHPYF